MSANYVPVPALVDKCAQLSIMVCRGPVLVHFDARISEMPAHLRACAHECLRFGYNLQPAIPDLELGEDFISGTLTFNGRPFLVRIPWPAVLAIRTDGEDTGLLWPHSIEAAEKRSPVHVPDAPTQETEPVAPSRGSHLKLV